MRRGCFLAVCWLAAALPAAAQPPSEQWLEAARE
jgi:hypothetical protein